MALPSGNRNRQYATVVRESKPKRYRMTVRARSALPTEEIKQLLKTQISTSGISTYTVESILTLVIFVKNHSR